MCGRAPLVRGVDQSSIIQKNVNPQSAFKNYPTAWQVVEEAGKKTVPFYAVLTFLLPFLCLVVPWVNLKIIQ